MHVLAEYIEKFSIGPPIQFILHVFPGKTHSKNEKYNNIKMESRSKYGLILYFLNNISQYIPRKNRNQLNTYLHKYLEKYNIINCNDITEIIDNLFFDNKRLFYFTINKYN